MDKNQAIGAGEIAGAGYLGYKGLSHGLPRALGIRIEYHTTSKANADLIKKAGYVLDPAFGGINGWAKRIKSSHYIKNSTGYIHITGMHKDCSYLKFSPHLKYLRTFIRRSQNAMYRTVGNGGFDKINKLFVNPKELVSSMVKSCFKAIFKNDTKRFCIPGIDSYFNKEFIPDVDDIALKTTKKLKVNTNRLSAMFSGLKKFGLKGIKENKGRVGFGIAIISLASYTAYKLCKDGIDKIRNKQEPTTNQV